MVQRIEKNAGRIACFIFKDALSGRVAVVTLPAGAVEFCAALAYLLEFEGLI